MKRRKGLWAALAAGCAIGVVGLGWAATFTWTGAGADDNWRTCLNWTVGSPQTPCYPDDTNDDAIVPSGAYDIVLINETIDDLTVDGSVEFTGESSQPPFFSVLNVDSLTINGGANGVTVTIGSYGVIRTY